MGFLGLLHQTSLLAWLAACDYTFVPRSQTAELVYGAAENYSERCRFPPAVGSSVPTFIFEPSDSPRAKGGVIVLHECMGVQQYILTIAEALASTGFYAAVPNIYRESVPGMSPTDCRYTSAPAVAAEATECMWKMQHLNWREAVQDVVAVATYLRQAHGIDGTAVWGFSMGAALTLLSASIGAMPNLRGALAFYGYPDNQTAPGAGALFDARSVHVPVFWADGRLDPFTGFSAPQMAGFVRATLTHTEVQTEVFEGCGHSFMNDAPWWSLDPAQQANETCRRDAFAGAVAFLSECLGVEAPAAPLPAVELQCSVLAPQSISVTQVLAGGLAARILGVIVAVGCLTAVGCKRLRRRGPSQGYHALEETCFR